MKLYRKRTHLVEAVKWTGDNIDEIKEFCPDSIIDDNGRLWIPAYLNMYCVQGVSYIMKNPNYPDGYKYRAVKPDEFTATYEEAN